MKPRNKFHRGPNETATAYLERVCPNYPPISTAPSSVTDLPGFDGLRGNGTAIDALEDRAVAEERGKLYSSVDSAGNIWLIHNPWALRHKRPTADGVPVTYIRRRAYNPDEEMSYEDDDGRSPRQEGLSI